MQSSLGDGTLLQKAEQAAFQIVDSYPRGTKFQLITNQFDAQEKRFTDIEGFLTLLDGITQSVFHREVSEIMQFHHQALIGEDRAKTDLFLISDFSNVLDSAPLVNDSLVNLFIVPIQNQVFNNVSVDSVWLSTPITQANIEQSLFIRTTNHGNGRIENLALSVILDGERIAMPLLTIEGKSTLDTSIVFTTDNIGWLSGKLVLEDAPVTFDNTYYFTLKVSQSIPVAEIFGDQVEQRSPFAKFFESTTFNFNAFPENQFIQSVADSADLLIINQINTWSSGLVSMMSEKLEAGNNVLIVLPEEMDQTAKDYLNESMGIKVGDWDTTSIDVNRISTDHYLFKDVFESPMNKTKLPASKGHYALDKASYVEIILGFINGNPLLATKRIGKGQCFILTSPLSVDYTTFGRHALFVPAMFNMAAHAGIRKPLAYPLFTQALPINSKQEVLELRHTEGKQSFIPGSSYEGLVLSGQVHFAGHYDLYSDQQRIEQFSFNYDRRESDAKATGFEEILAYFSNNEIKSNLLETDNANIGAEIMEAKTGTNLWPLFIALGLLLLLVETVLLKRQHA